MQEDQHNIEEYVDLEDLDSSKGGGLRAKMEAFLTGRYFVPAVIILVAIIAFCLGRISKIAGEREPVRIVSQNPDTNNPLNPPYIKGETEKNNIGEVKGANIDMGSEQSGLNNSAVVGSKNGTKYHYPWCAGAKQISEKNKITFNSIEEARAAGYTPASNCKGLK